MSLAHRYRPVAGRSDKRGPEPASTVRGFDVDFIEMREIAREHLHEREADRRVAGQSHPQAPLAGRVCKRVAVR